MAKILELISVHFAKLQGQKLNNSGSSAAELQNNHKFKKISKQLSKNDLAKRAQKVSYFWNSRQIFVNTSTARVRIAMYFNEMLH